MFMHPKAGDGDAGAMLRLAPLLLMLVATAALAEPIEDAPHRADRERTEALNRAAGAVVTGRDARNAASRRDYQAAHDRYVRELAAWRARFDACNAGDWSACR